MHAIHTSTVTGIVLLLEQRPAFRLTSGLSAPQYSSAKWCDFIALVSTTALLTYLHSLKMLFLF